MKTFLLFLVAVATIAVVNSIKTAPVVGAISAYHLRLADAGK